MILAIASGKGGTGKTTMAVNLARVRKGPVQLLDCDVEEPNCALFLKEVVLQSEEPVTLPVPEVDESLCTACGACARICEYNAIVSFGTKPLIFPEMCHGCGGCTLVCPTQAIRPKPRRIGAVRTFESGDLLLYEGRLDVGRAMGPPLIRAVRGMVKPDRLAILDAPPGTSCPVIAAVRDADFVLLVTEPTPFGLHDLTLAVETMRELSRPFAVAINRVGIGDDRIHRFCHEGRIPILFELPDDRRIAEAYSRGEIIVDALPEYRERFVRLLSDMEKIAGTSHANGLTRGGKHHD